MSTLHLGQHRLELLRLLARGEKEIEAGQGYDLDDVFAEADALLRQMQRKSPFHSDQEPRGQIER